MIIPRDRWQIISGYLLWFWAIVLGVLPAIVALDFGGILPWTQYVVSLVIIAGCSTLFAIDRFCRHSANPTPSLKSFALTGWLIALIGYSIFQTLPLPQGLVAWLSPASHLAYTSWCQPFVGAEKQLPISISVAPYDSWHPIAFLTTIALLSFVVPILYRERSRLSGLLLLITIGSSSIALIGLMRKLIPDFHLWSFQEFGEGAPYGSFLNRNNAALAMNIGLATAMGLMLRQSLVHSVDCQQKNLRSCLKVLCRSSDTRRDPLLLLSILGALTCMTGLIACGSRGGLLSTVVSAAAVSVFYFGKRTIAQLGGVIFLVGLLVVAVALRSDQTQSKQSSQTVPNPNALERIESSIDAGTSRLASDTRLTHWPDGWRAAMQHFPSGSGLATYGYAYLPWQQSGPWRHCAHADNLWLEMLVELGVPGLLLFLGIYWLLIRSLIRLYQSPDPIDQGLWLSGSFCMIALLISQTFDFGLIAPTNLIFVTLLLPVVVARGQSVVIAAPATHGDNVSVESRPKLQLLRDSASDHFLHARKSERVVLGVAFAGLLTASLLGTSRLHGDSQVDYLVRRIDSQFNTIRISPDRLKRLASDCELVLRSHPAPDLQLSLARIQFQIGRLQELSQLNFGRLPSVQQKELYTSTSRIRRRLGWRKTQPKYSTTVTFMGNPVQPLAIQPSLLDVDSAYSKSLRLATMALISRPLAIEPRMNFVYLEFVHQSEEHTARAISHCSDLFSNTPEIQLRLGAIAADQGDYELAIDPWKRATGTSNTMIRRTLHRAIEYPNFPVDQIIPVSEPGRMQAEQVLQAAGYSSARI